MNRAIGVIDSGVGGLTIAIEIMRQLPKERIIYLGDTARCPYGSRPKEEVLTFTWEIANFLQKHHIKALVIACNTATAFALDELKEQLDIPIIGVIKAGARAAITATETGEIGIIGTEGTIQSKAYEKALQQIKSSTIVHALACPAFAPMVEQGISSGDHASSIVKHSLKPLTQKYKMDTLILGCTHYPLLADTIQKVIGSHVTLISSSNETAREISTILDENNLLAKRISNPSHTIYTTGNLNNFKHKLLRIFPFFSKNSNHLSFKKAVL